MALEQLEELRDSISTPKDDDDDIGVTDINGLSHLLVSGSVPQSSCSIS